MTGKGLSLKENLHVTLNFYRGDRRCVGKESHGGDASATGNKSFSITIEDSAGLNLGTEAYAGWALKGRASVAKGTGRPADRRRL